MTNLQIAVVLLCIYWAVLQLWAIRWVDVPRTKLSSLFYLRVGVVNLLELILFWVLLGTGEDKPLVVTILLWVGLLQALVNVILLPAVPRAIKKKPSRITQGQFAFSCILYSAIAFAAVYTAFGL